MRLTIDATRFELGSTDSLDGLIETYDGVAYAFAGGGADTLRGCDDKKDAGQEDRRREGISSSRKLRVFRSAC